MTRRAKIVVGITIAVIIVGGIFGYKAYKKKKDEKKEEEDNSPKVEVPNAYEVAKKTLPNGKEEKDTYGVVVANEGKDPIALRFYKNNRVAFYVKGKLESMGTYSDGGKTKPTINIKFDNGKTMKFGQ